MHQSLKDSITEIDRLLRKIKGDPKKNKPGKNKLRRKEMLRALRKADTALNLLIEDSSFFSNLDGIQTLPSNLENLDNAFFSVESVLLGDAGISDRVKESLIKSIRNIRNQRDFLPSESTGFSTQLMQSFQESKMLVLNLITTLEDDDSQERKDQVQRMMKEVFKVIGGVCITVVNIANLTGSSDTARLSIVAGSAVIGSGNRRIRGR